MHTHIKGTLQTEWHIWVLSTSYERVLQLSTQMGNNVCQHFQRQQVVCPSQLRRHVFTTAAVDIIYHNPSSITAKDSFHGMAIFLTQHPSFVGEGVDSRLLCSVGLRHRSSNTTDSLSGYYTEVTPVTSKNLWPS